MNFKLKKHKEVVNRFIYIPLFIVIIVWIYSYAKSNIYDEQFLLMFIDNLFLPLYSAILWVVMTFYFQYEEKEICQFYVFEIKRIIFCISILITLKFIFITLL